MRDETLESLGKLLKEDLPRDAIHIAVAPVIANAQMKPGDHIGLLDRDAMLAGTNADELIGIVDPYLKGPVVRGDKFWMWLYPGTITSLKHHWTHKAFEPPKDDGMMRVQKSTMWLKEFADSWGMDYQDMIEGATDKKYPGIVAQSTDIHSWEEAGDGQKELFWKHIEVVTGKKFDDKHRENTHFSCSC